MVTVNEETRKGPWTEQEDLQLVCFVGLFGERRWDFIAKVSGLNRTGKSCRLRWVNYLQPGLKRGRITPQEERLILDLHARWGNRWSRIARKLPGRTDNEIKNYWRTHVRKKAQKRKRNASSRTRKGHNSPSLSETPSSECSELINSAGDHRSETVGIEENEGDVKGYSLDQIWNEIATSEAVSYVLSFEDCNTTEVFCDVSCLPMAMPSPVWDFCSDSLWKIDDEEFDKCSPTGDVSVSDCEHGTEHCA